MLKGTASPDGSMDQEKLHAALDRASEGFAVATAADVAALNSTLGQVMPCIASPSMWSATALLHIAYKSKLTRSAPRLRELQLTRLLSTSC